jgi:POT family proton-dependent oligopeptide transporter
MSVFALQDTDRTLWGLLDGAFPATWYQSVNPLSVIIFGAAFTWLWTALGRRGRDPSTPVRFALGLWLVVVPIAVGVVILALSPLLKRWMHGVT